MSDLPEDAALRQTVSSVAMMQSREPLLPWIRPVAEMIAQAAGRGGFFVVFPEYRPELIRAMTNALDFTFIDFRAEKLLPLGWEAGQVPLSALTAYIEKKSNRGGLVVHNAESILATKASEERRDWLKAFAAREWLVPVVVPITVFQDDLADQTERLCRIDTDLVPTESFIIRLASQ